MSVVTVRILGGRLRKISSVLAASEIKKVQFQRKSLSIEVKMKILNDADHNPKLSKKEIANKYDISSSTLSTILAQRVAIEKAAVEGSVKRKKLRTPKNEELEDILVEWFHQARANDIHLSGQHLKEEAEKTASRLHFQGFVATNGWLDRFRKRKGIVY